MNYTPRTDALIATAWDTVQLAQLARDLERELAAATETAERYRLKTLEQDASLATATATNHAISELTKDTGDDSLFNVRRLRNELRIAKEQLATATAELDKLTAELGNLRHQWSVLMPAKEQVANELRDERNKLRAALEIIGNECLDCQRIAREALAAIK